MAKTMARPARTTERSGRVDLRNRIRWGMESSRVRKADFIVEQQGLLILLHPLTNRAKRFILAFIGYEPLDGRFCIGNCYRLFSFVFDAIEKEGMTISAITADT